MCSKIVYCTFSIFRKNWFMKTNNVRYSEFGCQQRGLDGFFSTCEIGENEFIWAQLDSSWEQVLQSRQSLFWIFIRWHIWTKWKIKCKNIQKRKEIYVHDSHYYSIGKNLENISLQSSVALRMKFWCLQIFQKSN